MFMCFYNIVYLFIVIVIVITTSTNITTTTVIIIMKSVGKVQVVEGGARGQT